MQPSICMSESATASYWALAQADFTDPSYISQPPGQGGSAGAVAAKGFDIRAGGAVIVSFSGTYSGVSLVHEQTNDLTGSTGWFPVTGNPCSASGAVSSTGSSADQAYAFPVVGVRQRIRVTAIASGTIQARVLLSAYPLFAQGVITAIGPSGATANEVQGNTASGATDVGNPVKIGGVYNTTLPTLTDGQRGDVQIDPKGNLRSKLVGLRGAAADGQSNTNTIYVQDQDAASSAGAGPLNVANAVFNGTTFDRQRGSAAEGTIVKPYAFTASAWQSTQRLTAPGTTAIIAAGGAGVRNFITSIQMTWPPAIAATIVQILDGASVIAEFDLDAGGAGTRSLDLVMTFPVPLVGTANTALNVTIDTAGPVKFNAQGYRATT